MYNLKINDFEKLRELLIDEIEELKENCMHCLQESSEFERGRFYGEYLAYDNVIGMLRDAIKYGDIEYDKIHPRNLNE